MNTEDQLAEVHVREYESRMKHIDELIAKAEAAEALAPEHQAELAALKGHRAKLADALDQIQRTSLAEWAQKGGPMILWDLVAERVEKLVEHLE